MVDQTIEIKKFGNKKKVFTEENASVDQVAQVDENKEKVETIEAKHEENGIDSLDSYDMGMDEIKSETKSKLSEIINKEMNKDDLTRNFIKENDEEDIQKNFKDIISNDMNFSADLNVEEQVEKKEDENSITLQVEKKEDENSITLQDGKEGINSLVEPSIIFIEQDEMKTIELQSSMDDQDTNILYPLKSEEKNNQCNIEKKENETFNGFENHLNQDSFSCNPMEITLSNKSLEKEEDMNLIFSAHTSEPFSYSMKESLDNSTLYSNLIDTTRPLQSTGIVSHSIISNDQTLPTNENNAMTLHGKSLNIEIIYPPREILDDNLTNVSRAARRTPEETYNPSFEERLAEYNSTLLYLNSHLKDTEYYTSLPFVRNAAGHAYFLPKGSVLPNIYVNLPNTTRPTQYVTQYSSLPSQTLPKTQTTFLQPKFSFFNKLFHCCSSSNIDPSDLDSPRALYKKNLTNSQSLRIMTTNQSFSETSQLSTYDNKASVIQ